MNQQLKQKMYLSAIDEMQKKVQAYKSKPDAVQSYAMKQEAYLDAVTSYVRSLESQLQDERFNKSVLVTTVQGEQNGLVPILKRENEQLRMLLRLRGIDDADQSYLAQDSKEIQRALSIKQAQQTWKELY